MTDQDTDPTTNGGRFRRPRTPFTGLARWEDPPPRTTGPGNVAYTELVEVLKARPGQWAVAWEDAKTPSVATTLRDKGLEVATRTNGTDPPTWTIYTRWPEGQS